MTDANTPTRVVPTINDMLDDLGIDPEAFLAELAALDEGDKWFSAASRLVRGSPKYKVIAWVEADAIVADVLLASRTTIKAREPRTMLRLPIKLPDTLDAGAPGFKVGQLVGHPLLGRGTYVIDELQVPGHALTRMVWFKTALEELGAKRDDA